MTILRRFRSRERVKKRHQKIVRRFLLINGIAMFCFTCWAAYLFKYVYVFACLAFLVSLLPSHQVPTFTGYLSTPFSYLASLQPFSFASLPPFHQT